MNYHLQVSRTITDAIANGTLKAGDRVPTIRAICRDTGLAYATVSRAIRELSDAGVLVTRRGAGTVVAPTPAGRSGLRRHCIGIAGLTAVNQLSQSAYFKDVFLNLQEYFVSCGYAVSYDRWTADRPAVSLFDDLRAVDGVVAFGAGLVREEDLLPMSRSGLPMVVVGDAVRNPELRIVHGDNVYGARTAVESLIARGHRRILFSGHGMSLPAVTERLIGYHQAMAAAGLPVPTELVTEAYGVELGMYLAAMPERPTALFVASEIARFPGALPALYANDIHLGRDLYVCAYDERGFGVLASTGVPYSRVNQPTKEIARLAAGILLDQIAGRTLASTSITALRPQIEHLGGGPVLVELSTTLVEN